MASVAPVQAFADPEAGSRAQLPPLHQQPAGTAAMHAAAAVIGGDKTQLDPRKALAALRKQNPNFQGTVRLDALPANLRAVVAEFDDGDGEINLTELAATLSALQSSRKSAKHYARMACVGAVAGIILMVVVLGLTFLSVKLATPTGVANGDLVVAGTNDPVRVASAEFEVKDGTMKQRNGAAVSTSAAYTPQKLDSQLPDSYFMELRYIQLKSPNGANLHLDVSARARVPKKLSSHGNVIQLITPVGTLTLDGQIMSFDDKTAPILEAAGFEVHSETTSSGRRLAAEHEVVGWFNVFAELTEELGEDQSATFPEGDMSFTMTRYQVCGDECYASAVQETYAPNPNNYCPAQTSEAERDGKTILYGVVTIDGEDYKKETITTQVKTVNGVAVTRTSTTLDRFPGHILVKLAAGSEQRTFQTYGGDMYHCESVSASSSSSSSSSTGASSEVSDLQAELLGSDAEETAVVYEGVTKVGDRELRKYVMVTSSSLAVAAGFGIVIVYDDGEVPARLEAPDAGLIMDITDVQAAPELDDALFELPTCSGAAAANAVPHMGLGGIGNCVEPDAQNPWDATEAVADDEAGGESSTGGSGSQRRLLHLESLDKAGIQKLDAELEAARLEDAAAGRNLGAVNIALQNGKHTADVSYTGGLCTGTASKLQSKSYISLRLFCAGELWTGEMKLSGEMNIRLRPATGDILVSSAGAQTLKLEVKTMPVLHKALLKAQEESSGRRLLGRRWRSFRSRISKKALSIVQKATMPSTLQKWVDWASTRADPKKGKSWDYSTTIPASGFTHHMTDFELRCWHGGSGRHQYSQIVHSATGSSTLQLGAVFAGNGGSNTITFTHWAGFANLNKCFYGGTKGYLNGKASIASTVRSLVAFNVKVGGFSLQSEWRVDERPVRDANMVEVGFDRDCILNDAHHNVKSRTSMAFDYLSSTLMRTSEEQCHRVGDYAATQSTRFDTAMAYHFWTD